MNTVDQDQTNRTFEQRMLDYLSGVRTVFNGNQAVLLKDGPQTYKAMFEAIERAQDHINLETFTFEAGDVGNAFQEKLIDKAKQGITVNILYDDVGSITTASGFFDEFRQHGVNVMAFNPVNPYAVKLKRWRINHRNHSKNLVIDGKQAFVGGVNISNAYSKGSFSKRRAKAKANSFGWRDTHICLRGPVVSEFQQFFIDSWRSQHREPLPKADYFPTLEQMGDTRACALGQDANNTSDNPIFSTLLFALEQAQQRVWLTNAYFVPAPALMKALTRATTRGVDVRLILPGRTDSKISLFAGRSYYKRLLKAGARIYERHDNMVHAKTATIDGLWSTIGSTNLDWRSLVHNNELNAVVISEEFAQDMQRMFCNDLELADEIELETWRKRPYLHRLAEKVCKLWEYWL